MSYVDSYMSKVYPYLPVITLDDGDGVNTFIGVMKSIEKVDNIHYSIEYEWVAFIPGRKNDSAWFERKKTLVQGYNHLELLKIGKDSKSISSIEREAIMGLFK